MKVFNFEILSNYDCSIPEVPTISSLPFDLIIYYKTLRHFLKIDNNEFDVSCSLCLTVEFGIVEGRYPVVEEGSNVKICICKAGEREVTLTIAILFPVENDTSISLDDHSGLPSGSGSGDGKYACVFTHYLNSLYGCVLMYVCLLL